MTSPNTNSVDRKLDSRNVLQRAKEVPRSVSFKSFKNLRSGSCVTPTERCVRCVYVCFVVSSLLFFGQDLESFSTMDRALHSSFLAMFGDWDWNAMTDVGISVASVALSGPKLQF